jgi:hypothetical protein
MTALKKHVNVEHGLIAQNFEKEMNNIMKSLIKKQLGKKKAYSKFKCNVNFFKAIDFFKKDNVYQEEFMGNFGPTCSQKSFAHSIC